MMRRLFFFGAPLLAAVALLLTPAASQAQGRGGWGGGRGGWGGSYGGGGGYTGGWGGGYRSGGGWEGSYYPGYSYGWGGAYSPGYNYGWGSSYYQPAYGYYPSPSYYNSSPSYSYPYSNTYLTNPVQSGYQSFYPSETENPDVAYVRVAVPADADVIFEGQRTEKTQQGGTDRLFVTPALEKDKTYYYEVKARWTENGKEVERTKRVNIHVGDRAVVNFMNEAQEPNRTNETPAKEPANKTPNQR